MTDNTITRAHLRHLQSVATYRAAYARAIDENSGTETPDARQIFETMRDTAETARREGVPISAIFTALAWAADWRRAARGYTSQALTAAGYTIE